jgi:2-hydroxychromene-2-carboxylate isomerase
MPTAPILEFFWDVGSPYTYLAATQLPLLAQRTGATIRYRPFLLGGVFKSTGNSRPIEVAAKAAHLLSDLGRWRDHYGVPMKLPPEVPFPINTLGPMRAAVAADAKGKGEAFCHAVFRRYWAEGKDVSNADELGSVVASVGLDPREVLEASVSQEVKDHLRKNTEEAVQRGAFGAPAFFVGGELFWGNDRLHFVEAKLKSLR